ncbi:MAG TPA: 5-dehydro-4-deoxy-D-glucuronate isomerase, partial [Polyangiaceae bacterium]|nr:5-dehydro-4-deoxy-D-glucuronate isomerase [Polyangiaceae bacterium]
MYQRTLQATHPDMMRGADAQALADRYRIAGLFAPDAVELTYLHVERFVIGGAMPVGRALTLPKQPGDAPFLVRRELGIVNVGGPGRVRVD